MIFADKNLWPCSIIPSRYGGGYEGGQWLAFCLEFYDIPEEIYQDDVTCQNWFDNEDRIIFGKGMTPQEAYEDLIGKLGLG